MSTTAPSWGLGPLDVDTRGRLAGIDRWWLLVLAVLALIVFMIVVLAKPYAEIWSFIRDGIGVPLRISITTLYTLILLGILGGLGRISGNRIVRGASSLYVEVVRGIPLLVWLLYIWFALPQVLQTLGKALQPIAPAVGAYFANLRLDPFIAAVIGFTVCYGAYMTEIFRAGIESISKGQMEAARSLGMSYAQAMRYIVLPQAIRVILPPVGNEFVTLLKDSSLVSVLAVSDLTRRGREYVARSFLSFETFTMIALIYLLMTLIFTRVARWIEQRMTVGHR